MIALARRLAARAGHQLGGRALNKDLTDAAETAVRALGLAAVVAFAATAQPAPAAEPPRTVRLMVEQSYVYRQRSAMTMRSIERLELPLAELAVDLLVGAGAEPVGADAARYDATLVIEAGGEALGTLYFDSEARFLYTGANVRGALTLEQDGAAPYRVAFVGQVQRQRRIERDLGYEDPANAPFAEAMGSPGSFVDRLVEFVGAIYGAPALAAALLDGDRRLRPTAARVLGDMGDTSVAGDLIDALHDSDDEVRWQAAWSLGRLGDATAVEPLIEALADRNPDVRWFAAWSLGALTGQALGEDADAWAAWHEGEVGN